MRKLLLIAAAAAFAASTTFAHHSYSATYETTKSVALEGTIVQFVYRNPHSFVHIDAPDAQGVSQRWAVEWGGTGQLGAQGVTRETLRPGDVVVITGNPGRNPADFRVRMVTLRRTSDGYGWGEREGERFD